MRGNRNIYFFLCIFSAFLLFLLLCLFNFDFTLYSNAASEFGGSYWNKFALYFSNLEPDVINFPGNNDTVTILIFIFESLKLYSHSSTL